MSLTRPACPTLPRVKGKKLYFFIILKDGTKKNLLTLPGIEIVSDWELHFETNKVREFKFTYRFNKEISEIQYLLGVDRNEVQIYRDTDLIFDGYILNNTYRETYNHVLSLHTVTCVGTEQIYTTDYVRGVTTFVNLTSKEIIERVGAEWNKQWDNRLPKPIVNSSLKTKWQEALNIDGQYSRLFDIIKDREHAQYIYKPKGQVHFMLESDCADGGSLSTLIEDTSQPTIEHLNDTKVNRSIVKYKDVSGSLANDIVYNNTGGNSTTITVNNEIYDIKSIDIDGNKDFTKSLTNADKDKKTYNFNNNQITITGVDNFKVANVQYWIKDSSGVVSYDDEKSITSELDYREFSSTIHTQEISNERVASASDVLGYAQEHTKFVNREQYKLNFTVYDASIDLPWIQEYFDLNKYKWTDEHYHAELKDKYVWPNVKILKQRVTRGCGEDHILLEDCYLDLEFSTDQSNHWENGIIRDKNQYTRHQQNTINVSLHHDWDIGDCNVSGGVEFTKSLLCEQSPIADVSKLDPQGHIKLEKKVVITKSNDKITESKGVIKCIAGNRAYMRGFVFKQYTLPEDWALTKGYDEKHPLVYDYTTGDVNACKSFVEQHYNDVKWLNANIYIYSHSEDKWFLFAMLDDTPGHITYQNVPHGSVTKWFAIPVDANIFRLNTNQLASTFDTPTEWKLTERNKKIPIEHMYFNPLQREFNFSRDLTGEPNFTVTPVYGEQPTFRKFIHYDGTWETNLSISPNRSWDDKKCAIKKDFEYIHAVDKNSGEDAHNVHDWLASDNIQKLAGAVSHWLNRILGRGD